MYQVLHNSDTGSPPAIARWLDEMERIEGMELVAVSGAMFYFRKSDGGAKLVELQGKVTHLRKACKEAEGFLFRLVRDSGNNRNDPAKPVLAAVRKALRETGQ